MKTATEIIDYLGRDKIGEMFGLSRRRVNEIMQTGEIPAAYYDALEKACGRPLPRQIFSFKTPEAGAS
jgi:hypothetical protein